MKTIARLGLLTALVAGANAPVAASDFIVTKIADTADGVCDADCSLREAIIAANAQAGADRVVLGNGLTYTLTRGPADAPGTLVAGTGDLDVTDALTIDGNGSTIDAAGLDRVLDIEGSFSATINSLTIRGGIASGFLSLGGGVFIRTAAVVFNNSSVRNNSTAVESGLRDDGGGIAVVGTFNAATGVATVASLTLNNTTVATNTGASGGGVICVLCQLTTSNTTVTGNVSAAGDGAGLALVGNASSASITGGAWTGNTGAARGGAIAVPAGTGSVGITRSRMLSNGATLGSGIFNHTATVSAANNWWGCNFGPGAGGDGCAITADSVSGAATTTPYLVLQTSATPAVVNPSVGTTFTADLRRNSAGADVSAGGTVQDGIIVAFAGTLGSFTQPTVPTSAGQAANVFTAGAAAGSASLSATADNQTVASTLPIVLPQVALDTPSLTFAATTNGSAFTTQTGTQTVHLTQSGIGLVTWTATSNQPWLVVSPASGSGPAMLNVSVQFASGLAASQTGAITLAFTGAGNTAGPINVTLNTVPVQVAIDKTSLLFGATASNAAFLSQTGTQAVHITQSGVGPVTWTAMSNQPWLVVSPTSGSGTGTLNVSVQFVPDLAALQTGSITLAFTGATNTAGPIGVTLTTVSVPSAPFGAFDTPMNGATGIAGSIAVTGWALDDVQVTSVAICRDPVLPETAIPDSRCNNQPKLFVGNAVFIDNARPDVQTLHPDLPLSSRAGWGYLLLTNFLPGLGNGTYNLFAYASDADGHTSLLGSKTITCNNSASTSPFGAIDTPAQGEVISGSGYANFGWVLSPAPAFADPPDGGTVSVFVDGVNVGSPGLWTSRPDLTALFPSAQYPGVNMALGVFGLDTTALTNGLHSIAWIVTGTNGAAAGVGSRFFTVSNGASIQAAQRASASRVALRAASPTTDVVDAVPVDVSPISVRRGFDLDAPLELYRAQGDAVVVQAEELGRLELHLGPAPDTRVAGFLRTPAGLVPLPAGSQLDPSTGVFVWQPGAGFLGTYQFVFIRSTGGQAVTRQQIRIVLSQKRP